MKVIYDFHMHTFRSDGKSTIEENVIKAIESGLEIIAITDHGPGHMFFGIKEKQILDLRKEVDRLNKKYDNIEILLGIEANILGVDGSLDVSDLIKENIDILLAGYHFGSKPKRFFRDFKIHLYNFLGKKSEYFKQKIKDYNTLSLINAMKNHSIDILTHPGDKGQVDIEKIAKTALETKTVLEINKRHKFLNVDQLKKIKDYPINFVVSSDAHHFSEIGEYDNPLYRVEKSKLDIKKVINIRED